MQTGADYNIDTLGAAPKREDVAELGPGEIGIFTGSIKEVADARVGDTITDYRRETAQALPASSRRSLSCSAVFFRRMRRTLKICALRCRSFV